MTRSLFVSRLSRRTTYYDERDCEEAYRRAATVFLHGRELTVEFARGSRKTPREMRGKDSNRYSPPRRSRYTPENSYRPRRYSRSPSRHRSRSRSDYKRYDYEEDRRRTSRYRSRSRTLSRTPPERRKRSGQVNGHPKSRSRSPRGVQAPVEEKETAT
ncbi:23580_t:CDS:2 [Cetraspora pellucida]|uniref:23580_t:CDS:1 n=1 Tax=Cetraspora pellucida TaxID=1433469 RepID=A0A9N9IGP8_9GLOM|nr:23580_t:CDS:2 [Cetraspora pellucida]